MVGTVNKDVWCVGFRAEDGLHIPADGPSIRNRLGRTAGNRSGALPTRCIQVDFGPHKPIMVLLCSRVRDTLCCEC